MVIFILALSSIDTKTWLEALWCPQGLPTFLQPLGINKLKLNPTEKGKLLKCIAHFALLLESQRRLLNLRSLVNDASFLCLVIQEVKWSTKGCLATVSDLILITLCLLKMLGHSCIYLFTISPNSCSLLLDLLHTLLNLSDPNFASLFPRTSMGPFCVSTLVSHPRKIRGWFSNLKT